jgi:hypothetical protein
MVYSWKEASRIKADAQIAGEMCEELERTVGLTPKSLVDANRDKTAPLHDEFEWNNDIAADKYRETQAQYIIRMLCVGTENKEKQPSRAFYSIVQGDHKYESLSVIVESDDKAKKLLQAAYKELMAFKQKYESLAELIPVFDIIDEVTQNIGER